MPIEQPQLWARIEAFVLDEGGGAVTFSRRLAREQGWSRSFARRAILEYRRFAYLAVAAGHPVCPSDAVDEVWHLHLTFTRSYWQYFCPQVLGRPLHHEPTRGGPAERQKHLRMYEQTLATYRRTFDAEPPADIWPAPAERFRPRRWRRIDAADYWFVPRRGTLRAFKTAAVAFATIALAGCGPVLLAVSNPLDWTGPEFLEAFMILGGVMLAVAIVLRSWLRSTVSLNVRTLQPSQLAYVARNRQAAMNSAVAALAHAGSIKLDTDPDGGSNVKPGEQVPSTDDFLQQAVYTTVAEAGSIRLRDLYKRLDDDADAMDDDLTERGFLITRRRAIRARLLPAIVLAPVLILGVVKVIVGLDRERPVGWLIVLSVALLLVILYMVLRHDRRSLSAAMGVQRLRTSRDVVRKQVRDRTHLLDPRTVATAVALFGVPAIAKGPLSPIGTALDAETPRRSGFDFGFEAGCGGACGGGGGCGGGCGGCGCGGCGG